MKLALHIWLSLILATPVWAEGVLPAPPPESSPELPPGIPPETNVPASPPTAASPGGHDDLPNSAPGGERPSAGGTGIIPVRIRATLIRVLPELQGDQREAALSNLQEVAVAAEQNLLHEPAVDALMGEMVTAAYSIPALRKMIDDGLAEYKDRVPAQAATLAGILGLVPACWSDPTQPDKRFASIEEIPSENGASVLVELDDKNPTQIGYPLTPPDCLDRAAPTPEQIELYRKLGLHIQALQATGQPVGNINDERKGNDNPGGQDFIQGEQPGGQTGQPGQPGEPGQPKKKKRGRGKGDGNGGGGPGAGDSGGSPMGGAPSGGGAGYQSKAEKMEPMKAEQPQPTQPLSFQGLQVPEVQISEGLTAAMAIPQESPERAEARKAQMDSFITDLNKLKEQAMQAVVQLSQAYQANLQGPIQSGGSQLLVSNTGSGMFGRYADRIRSAGSGSNVGVQGVRAPASNATVGRTLPSAMGSGMLATTPTPRRVERAGSPQATRPYLPVINRSKSDI